MRGKNQTPSRRPGNAAWRLGCLGLLSLLNACRDRDGQTFIPNTGQIQVLNGCGKSGAAERFRNYLTDLGFDVIEFGNAATWNYPRTIVVARTDSASVAEDLARVLGTGNLVHLEDSAAMVDATVFVGKDYEELMNKWQKRR